MLNVLKELSANFNTARSGITIVMSGQSNANGMLFSTGVAPVHTDLVQLLVGESSNYTASPAFTVGSFGTCNSRGLSAIADAIHTTYPTLPIRIIHNSYSGSSITTWGNSGKPSDNFGQTIAQVLTNARDADYFIWVQGETDAINGMAKATYKAYLANLFTQLKLALQNPNLKFIVTVTGGATGASGPNIQAIRDAQTEFAAETAGVIYGGTLVGLTTSDGMHLTYNPTGVGALGNSIGSAIAADLFVEAAPPSPAPAPSPSPAPPPPPVTGAMVKRYAISDGTFGTINALTPYDNTAPLSSEGTQWYVTDPYTPLTVGNTLRVIGLFNVSNAAANVITAALFRNAETTSVAAALGRISAANLNDTINLMYEMVAADLNPITFKTRFGSSVSGAIYMNGNSGAGRYGGVGRSWIIIEEYAP